MALFERLSGKQIKDKVNFMKRYAGAENSAEGSLVDANSNVTNKNIAIMETEMHKMDNIQINRYLIREKLKELFPDEPSLPDQYIKDLESHLIYENDETSFKPYCASVTMFPFLLHGTKILGGTSLAPKNLRSFTGSFVNFVYQVASFFSGAIATVEWPLYFDYFAKKTYGPDYLKTNRKDIEQELQGTIYPMNQPAAARGNQSVFWNTSMLDRDYFDWLYGGFRFPDGTKPEYDGTFKEFQMFFMDWFRREREKELLTYPVLTCSVHLNEDGTPADEEFARSISKHAEKGLSFFVYESKTVDSLSSCCRLRNQVTENTFSYTLGAGGISTGSIHVTTLNANRFVQQYPRGEWQEHLQPVIERMHKYLYAHDALIHDFIDAGLLTPYDAGLIDINKQYRTVGVNGLLEASEYETGGTDLDFYTEFLKYIHEQNVKDAKKYNVKFNCELIPAENLGVKNANWDKKDGILAARDCYNSYLFPVEDDSYNVIDKMRLHGEQATKYLDGGSACHLNLEQLLTADQFYNLILVAGKLGTNYWTFNVLMTCCNECGHIDVNTLPKCPKCGSEDVDYATRVIGYLKRITNFSLARQKEAGLRYYNKPKTK